MSAPTFIGPLTQDESKSLRIYYVIYSIDLTRDGEHLVNQMDPNAIGANEATAYDYGPSLKGRWHETEGDEQYDYNYLADEMSGRRDCPMCGGERTTIERFDAPEGFVGVGIIDRQPPYFASDSWHISEERPCETCGGSGDESSRYRNGWYRKWVAELTHPEYLRLADDRGWDLDDDDRPTRFNDTMGSLTEHGHLPAIAVDDDEGWTYGGEVIYAQFYVTMGELPLGYSEPLRESEAV
jgi:hypothetical protein